ncbi:MAG: DUF4012 domain-containing protein [Firmicutes bacterium]|nr:DUF4012 domain-containing protein [Bacillota bacterium]
MVSARETSRKMKRYLALGFVVCALLVLGEGSFWAIRVTNALEAVQSRLPSVSQAVASRHWTIAIKNLAQLAAPAQQLSEDLGWVKDFAWVPGLGPDAMRLGWLITALTATTTAAQAWRPLVTAWDQNPDPLNATLSRLTPAAVLAAAEALHMLEAVPPKTLHVSSPLERRFAAFRREVGPWAQLGAVLTHDPHAVKTFLRWSHTARFLVLFQDSGELRSTGGFLAAYGYLTWRHRHVSLTFEPNIATLNNHLRLHFPAPWVIREYFGEQRLSFINANINPNVPTSARLIERLYDSVPHHRPIQGIVWVNSWFADQVIQVLGAVRADGVTFTAHNLLTAMEYMAERRPLPGSRRLLFLGQILDQLRARAETSQGALAELLPIIREALRDQEVMLYANNPGVETWLTREGWAGAIPPLPHTNSFLLLNDNYGGLKDNYELKTGVRIDVKRTAAGRYLETVDTTWTMTGVADGWMIGTYVGWVQCLMPRGTRLVSLVGEHLHGIRRTTLGALHRVAYGTGILIAPRRNATSPPHVRRLKWTFELPRLAHPRTLVYLVQPGIPAETVTYDKGSEAVTRVVHHSLVLHVR